MYTRHICTYAHDGIKGVSAKNRDVSAALSEFAEVCRGDGRRVVTVVHYKGGRYFRVGGFVCLSDGTLVEVLPPVGNSTEYARNVLCAEFCRRCGYKFSASAIGPDTNFMEYVISVFAGETMKIIKSGVLSAYASREENMNTVHGTILFAENNRRNLVHRERIYVRHDVFTPDRAENRIIKAAAAMLNKLTVSAQSSHLLKETLSYLDEVVVPYNIVQEFPKCINTRNAKKYGTVLNICRMLFDGNAGTSLTGKGILCAQFYKMNAALK